MDDYRKRQIQEKRIATLKANKLAKKRALELAESNHQAILEEQKQLISSDLVTRQIEILRLYQDAFDICRAIVDSAKDNPLEVSASKLNVVLRMLDKSEAALKRFEAIQQHQQDIDDRGGDPEGMTEQEKQMIKDFEEIEKGIIT